MSIPRVVLGGVVILIGIAAVIFGWAAWSEVRAVTAEPQEMTLEQLIERKPETPTRLALTDFGIVNVDIAHAKPDSDQWTLVYVPLVVKGAKKGDPVKVVFKSRHVANKKEFLELVAKNKLDATLIPNTDANMSPRDRAALKEKMPKADLSDFMLVEDRYEPSRTNTYILGGAGVLFLLLGSVMLMRGLRGDIG